MLGRGVQVALLVLVGCRLLGGLRGKLGKKSRERRRLAQEAEMVMSELANADHYLKDNFEATPERIALLDEQTAFANLASSKKRKNSPMPRSASWSR